MLHKEKIAPEAELLALLESDQEPKVLEALAATQYPDKFRLRYPAVRRALKDLMRWLDAASWNDDTASSPHVEYQVRAQGARSGLPPGPRNRSRPKAGKPPLRNPCC